MNSKNQDWKKLMSDIRQAKKDPGFRRELKEFVKITSR